MVLHTVVCTTIEDFGSRKNNFANCYPIFILTTFYYSGDAVYRPYLRTPGVQLQPFYVFKIKPNFLPNFLNCSGAWTQPKSLT